jgi:hypothetical protein
VTKPLRTLGCALIAAFLWAPPAAAQQLATDSLRFDRLAALGRLWATVKYFHPALADRPIDWDSALVAAVPAVTGDPGAAGTERFGAVVQRMLDALGDPASRLATVEPAGKVSATDPGPRGRRLADGTWLIEVHNYADLGDYPSVADRLRAMADSARRSPRTSAPQPAATTRRSWTCSPSGASTALS